MLELAAHTIDEFALHYSVVVIRLGIEHAALKEWERTSTF